MDQEHAALLARLERFDFDAGSAAGAFAARLAHENDWSPSYGQRVCREYTRFAFLAVVAGHPCTPSDQVDQAWHLHLLHTREYWGRFCEEVLGTPLHHTPTRGGAQEQAKFHDWYARTLQSYRTWFGHDAPCDIWPPASQRFGARHVRVERTAHWLVRKPSLPWATFCSSLLWLALAGLALSGCSLVHSIPPFDLRGPSFLALFVQMWLGSLLVVAGLRFLAGRAQARSQPPVLHPYEVAYLAGGTERLTHALVATLVEHGNLELDRSSERERLVATERPLERRHPLELTVWSECAGMGVGVYALQDSIERLAEPHVQQLERAGLIFSRVQARRWYLLALLAPVLGVIKLAVGVSMGKPVIFLVMLCIAAFFVASSWLGNRVQLTAAGKAALARLRREQATAHSVAGADAVSASAPVELAVGLFGLGILADTGLADLGQALSKAKQSGGDGGGGGGCGGGGCGGGGCGGCGGCGGE